MPHRQDISPLPGWQQHFMPAIPGIGIPGIGIPGIGILVSALLAHSGQRTADA